MDKDKALRELKRFKKMSGWSYDRIAREMNVHSQTVIGWFHGKYRPSALALQAIETFLGENFKGGKK